MANLKQLLDDLDMRDYLDVQGLTYKTSRSRKGTQLIVKDCPVCGSEDWKVYLNEATGLGNCLAGETEILTREHGAIAIESVSGQTVTLLDGNGDWVPCMIHDHGIQTTYLTKFGYRSGTRFIRSTAEHGWITPEGDVVLTQDLRVKKDRSSLVADLRHDRRLSDAEEHAKGVIHGLIYGDGTKEVAGNYRMRVCSHKESIEPHLERFHYSDIKGDRRYYIPRVAAWSEFKELPDAANCHIDYLVGFFRGWLATDGCVSTNAGVTLCCGLEEAEWVRKWAPVVGWLPGKHSMLSEETNYGKRNKMVGNVNFAAAKMIADDFLVLRHRSRWTAKYQDWKRGSQKWSFRKTPEGKTKPYSPRSERVYCPVVPTTSSFALANGLHSRNCFAGDHPPGENFNKWSFIKANIGAGSGKQVVDHIEQHMDAAGFVIERERVETSYKALDSLPKPALKLPTANGEILQYLLDRGITERTCKYFHLQYSAEGSFEFMLNGDKRYQDFSGRVIIPVLDLMGSLKTFQGRDITGTAEDKYRFATGMPASGAYLYNGHNALGKQHLIVCEGAFDVWSVQQFLWERGMDDVEAVGTFGKHLSQVSDDGDDQLSAFLILKDAGLESVTFMWDSEPAAIRDALKFCDLLQQHGLSTRIAMLPEGLDPNDATPGEIGKAVASAKPFSKALKMKMRLKML